jgi:hypothetical protein
VPRFLTLASLIAALTLIAGCTSSSTSSSGTAPTATAAAENAATSNSTGANGAGAAPTSAAAAENATVEVAEPSATAGPAPSPTPDGIIDVIGDDAFKTWVERALALIETKAPDAYREVSASIESIESVPAGSGMHVVEKRFDVGDETAHAPGYDEANQLLWFAGTIVHDAHHSARYMQGLDPSGKEAEVDCLTHQLAALKLMTANPFFANYVQGLIDGADDPANQYWNQPNRHW